MIKVTYQAESYKPELVTGRYVRWHKRIDGQIVYHVFETATCTRPGQFFNRAGYGYTLREYLTLGEEVPADVVARAAKSKTTELWEIIE